MATVRFGGFYSMLDIDAVFFDIRVLIICSFVYVEVWQNDCPLPHV